jgi:hypothetical protein
MYFEFLIYLVLPALVLFGAGYWVGRHTRGRRVDE